MVHSHSQASQQLPQACTRRPPKELHRKAATCASPISNIFHFFGGRLGEAKEEPSADTEGDHLPSNAACLEAVQKHAVRCGGRKPAHKEPTQIMHGKDTQPAPHVPQIEKNTGISCPRMQTKGQLQPAGSAATLSLVIMHPDTQPKSCRVTQLTAAATQRSRQH